MQTSLNLVHRLLYQPSPPLAPAPSACRDQWQRAVHCVGLGTRDETTLTLPIPIHQPLPATRYLPEAPAEPVTLYESVASIMLKLASLFSIFIPLDASQSQLSVCCVARLAAAGDSESGSVGRQGGGTCVESVRLRSALPGQPISGQNRFTIEDCLHLRRWTTGATKRCGDTKAVSFDAFCAFVNLMRSKS